MTNLFLMTTVITFILLFVLYFNIKHNYHLKKEIEKKAKDLINYVKLYDKNVIFSKTDLTGIITHVSEAFCEVSGYKDYELIGKPHSIVRHPDMPKEAFKAMWDTLHTLQKWSGEVKNKKKDGGYYWVAANIEADYNDAGLHVGYSAVRHNITAQKEVEELKSELESINNYLEDQVNEKIIEIVSLNKDVKETQKEIIFTMGTIGESRSKETGNHVKRVAEYSKLLALHSGMHEYEAELLKQASPMHDIGKVGIADAILNKPGRFDEHERKIMDSHAKLGYEMLKHSDKQLLKIAATVAHEHHEKYDGTGYPNGLKGEEITIYGRITALADVFDALGSDRVYKKAWDDESIFKMFKEQSGKHFDPNLVDIFFNNLDEFLEVRDKFIDKIA
ncbi:HD-GYP domain-containing protein [Candidatus Sulfurimonas baltica]|nr:HD domain-containing phosphohydrolase [Candidatus Sulfurimonas baltica]